LYFIEQDPVVSWTGSREHAERSELAYVTEFVEDVKASGIAPKAIDQAGPRGLTVPPPGDAR